MVIEDVYKEYEEIKRESLGVADIIEKRNEDGQVEEVTISAGERVISYSFYENGNVKEKNYHDEEAVVDIRTSYNEDGKEEKKIKDYVDRHTAEWEFDEERYNEDGEVIYKDYGAGTTKDNPFDSEDFKRVMFEKKENGNFEYYIASDYTRAVEVDDDGAMTEYFDKDKCSLDAKFYDENGTEITEEEFAEKNPEKYAELMEKFGFYKEIKEVTKGKEKEDKSEEIETTDEPIQEEKSELEKLRDAKKKLEELTKKLEEQLKEAKETIAKYDRLLGNTKE